MNADEDYGFDVSGYLHIPGLLSTAEVGACNRAIEAGEVAHGRSDSGPLRAVLESPGLAGYLESLCGADYVLDKGPILVGDGVEETAGAPLSMGPPEDRRRLRYANYADTRVSKGLRLFLALAPTPDDGGVILVPGSHNRVSEPPADFLAGTDDLGMTEQPELQAGDILLCSTTTLYGIRGRPGRLLEIQIIQSGVTPSGGHDEVEGPEWLSELSPEKQLVVGPRMTGRSGRLVSDGTRSWVADVEEQPAAVVFGLDEHSQPDPDEYWFWDVRGYLVLRGVMDAAWLAAANRALDAALEMQESLPPGHPTRIEDVPEQAYRENDYQWPEETSDRLYGTIHRPRIGGLYQLPHPHCEPFRRMIAHPAVVRRLNWMLGYGYREADDAMCCSYPKGTSGGSLHGQNPRSFTLHHGRHLCEQVNVAWALHDEAPGFGEVSGGFICVPGSHKAHYPIPGGLTTSIDLPQVHKPAMKAGDVLFFGTVAHGTTAWRSEWPRRTVIQFMSPSHADLPPGGEQAGWRWSNDPNNMESVEVDEEAE